MRQRFTFLLMIAGGVLAAFTPALNIPFVVLTAVTSFIFAFGLMTYTSRSSGVVWGIRIKSSASSKLLVFLSAIGLVVGGYSLYSVVVGVLVGLTSGRLIEFGIGIVVYIAVFLIGGAITKKILEKHTAKEKNGMVLDNLDIFKEIEANIDEAVYFVVSFEGVALFSGTNYCYALYRYEDYRLGELTTVNEVAMVGIYFCQKYSDRYTFKVQGEVIPGEPGQTAVAVGTGGIAVAHSAGTPPQYEFKSYVFTRK